MISRRLSSVRCSIIDIRPSLGTGWSLASVILGGSPAPIAAGVVDGGRFVLGGAELTAENGGGGAGIGVVVRGSVLRCRRFVVAGGVLLRSLVGFAGGVRGKGRLARGDRRQGWVGVGATGLGVVGRSGFAEDDVWPNGSTTWFRASSADASARSWLRASLAGIHRRRDESR